VAVALLLLLPPRLRRTHRARKVFSKQICSSRVAWVRILALLAIM